MYDPFSADYDRFVDWPGRLAAELPLIERQLQGVGAHRVPDAACGTGMHAVTTPTPRRADGSTGSSGLHRSPLLGQRGGRTLRPPV